LLEELRGYLLPETWTVQIWKIFTKGQVRAVLDGLMQAGAVRVGARGTGNAPHKGNLGPRMGAGKSVLAEREGFEPSMGF